MKRLASILTGFIACYIALILASENLGAISTAACSPDFTLPGIACRVGGGLFTLLLVPLSGIIAFCATWYFLESRRHKND